ncbi:dihydrolipoyl dehydrogenase family protein [Acuticoccus mangrovi]|uniref:FAD-dependent oxidoreductase n=1 Tax=Acuticoccus mangrovi TaxID=2796142 RepID=A0A934MGV1_9HYPH|nr:FAD-dependent oxidoreductase [Acuticoccus mangrovi]MBJ3775391.1 FAD-dependent oxidoreductase [Acuticoccus mangrovi]
MSTLTPDICVIGGGSAGLTVAAAGASFGHDVVLVERGEMGGDCLNTGCVPSKALIAAARYAHAARAGARFGVAGSAEVDYAAVHAHVAGAIATIAPIDSVERFEGLGVRVMRESARFLDGRTVVAGEATIRARRFVIATGSRPVVPPIEGLAEVGPLTNESVFDLTRLPARLLVIGGGPIGAELSQAFARLGAAVTVVEASRLLGREDPAAVDVVRGALADDGVRLIEGVGIARCVRVDGGIEATLSDGRTIVADDVLVAVGRRAATADLDLAAAGIETREGAVVVDHGLRTANRRVFAIGDVTGGLQFTHVAGHQASLAVRAIVFRLPVRYRPELMPRVTYTAPELAQVGPTEAELRAGDARARAETVAFTHNDRAVADGDTRGFVKLLIDGRGKLAGATIVGPNAGEMIAPYALALAGKVKLSTIASFVPPYPTRAEAGKRAAVNHFAASLTKGWVRKLLMVLKRL